MLKYYQKSWVAAEQELLVNNEQRQMMKMQIIPSSVLAPKAHEFVKYVAHTVSETVIIGDDGNPLFNEPNNMSEILRDAHRHVESVYFNQDLLNAKKDFEICTFILRKFDFFVQNRMKFEQLFKALEICKQYRWQYDFLKDFFLAFQDVEVIKSGFRQKSSDALARIEYYQQRHHSSSRRGCKRRHADS